MARKAAPYNIVIHCPDGFAMHKLQALIDDFYVHQVKHTLDNSNLDMRDQQDILNWLIDLHQR